MKVLLDRLQLLVPLIIQICEISGNAGLSLGVLHQGQIVHTAHFGYRDVEVKIELDDHTVYFIAFLTKTVTAAAFGLLVDDGKLTWDTKVSDILPEFQQHSEPVNNSTILDLLAHRMGIAMKNCFWIQGNQQLLTTKEQVILTANYLEPVAPFRERWVYNNWGYCLASDIIERVTGESYGAFLKNQIFDPLGMKDTTAKEPSKENLAEAYMSRQNGTPCKIARPGVSDATFLPEPTPSSRLFTTCSSSISPCDRQMLTKSKTTTQQNRRRSSSTLTTSSRLTLPSEILL